VRFSRNAGVAHQGIKVFAAEDAEDAEVRGGVEFALGYMALIGMPPPAETCGAMNQRTGGLV
jgi:hypothetical protein